MIEPAGPTDVIDISLDIANLGVALGKTLSAEVGAASSFYQAVKDRLVRFRCSIIEDCAVTAEIALSKVGASDIRRMKQQGMTHGYSHDPEETLG